MSDRQAQEQALEDIEWPITEEALQRLARRVREAGPPPPSTLDAIVSRFARTGAQGAGAGWVDLQAAAGAVRGAAVSTLLQGGRDAGLHVIHIPRLDSDHDAMRFPDLDAGAGAEAPVYELPHALATVARSTPHPGMVVVIDDLDHADLRVWWLAKHGVERAQRHLPVWAVTVREPGPLSALPMEVGSQLAGSGYEVVVR